MTLQGCFLVLMQRRDTNSRVLQRKTNREFGVVNVMNGEATEQSEGKRYLALSARTKK